jgi:hypothetical protein
MKNHRIDRMRKDRDRLKEKIAKWQKRVDLLDAKIGKAEGACPHVPVRIGERLACRVCNAELGTVTIPEGIKNDAGKTGEATKQDNPNPLPVRNDLPDDKLPERPPV